MTAPLTVDQANAVYDILVEHAGASDAPGPHDLMTPRGEFVFHQTSKVVNEYRFQGSLGFGGKFWNYRSRWYVTAYPEALRARPELQQFVDRTNEALAALKAEKQPSST